MNTDGELIPFAEGVWTATIPAKILGMTLTVSMTVLRLKNDELLVYSPVRMSEQCRETIQTLGTVTHIYSPNLFHHLYVAEWLEAYPTAKFHAPKNLAKKRPDLQIHKTHEEGAEPSWDGIVDVFPIRGFRLEESVLLYRPTGTLIVADLVHNVGQPKGAWTVFYTKMMGFYDRVAMSRMIRWLSFSDKKAVRQSIDSILQQPIKGLIVGHGLPLESGGKEAIQEAFSWLK